jgi:hypothetical protein
MSGAILLRPPTNSIEGRENGDLGAPLNLQMSETRILIGLLRMHFPMNREFGLVLSKLRIFGVGWGLNSPHLAWHATVNSGDFTVWFI